MLKLWVFHVKQKTNQMLKLLRCGNYYRAGAAGEATARPKKSPLRRSVAGGRGGRGLLDASQLCQLCVANPYLIRQFVTDAEVAA